ncbi:MAG: hypothetical protein WD137_05775 [Balneolaceae bacterium]
MEINHKGPGKQKNRQTDEPTNRESIKSTMMNVEKVMNQPPLPDWVGISQKAPQLERGLRGVLSK